MILDILPVEIYSSHIEIELFYPADIFSLPPCVKFNEDPAEVLDCRKYALKRSGSDEHRSEI